MNIQRYYLLDIVRGIAAFSVVIFHYKIFYRSEISNEIFFKENAPLYNFLYFVYEYGWMAVQFFFILSGFIFYTLYMEKIQNKKISKFEFFKLRFSRLYPLHFFTLLICLLIYVYSTHYGYPGIIVADLKHFILNFFLIHKWGLEELVSFNRPSWSISIESLLYIVFFFVFSFNFNKYAISIICIFVGGAIFFLNKNIGYGIYCFFIGGLTCLIFSTSIKIFKNLNIYWLFTFLLLIISCIILTQIENPIYVKIFIFTFLFPILILNLMSAQNIFKDIGKIFSIIGDISYSVYLLHYPIQAIIIVILFKMQLKINFDSPTLFISYIIFIFLISFISFKYLEKPFQKLIRNY